MKNLYTKRIAKRKLFGTAMSAVLASQAIYAQDAANNDTEDDVEEIIVTVERRSQTLQSYAGTATAISGEDIKLLGLQNINDLDGKIPGVSIANNQGNIEIFIRGVGSSNNTELGDPAAATHLNGVYVPRPSGFGAAFFDIQRVEVNVGPQGTLRGRNATAGSVNIIPWGPGLGVWDAAVEASYGNFNEYRIEGVINAPITDNSALRIAAFTLEHDSRLESVTPNSADLGLSIPTSEEEGVGVAEAADDFGIRGAYLIKPTDRLTFTITGDYIEQKGTGFTGVNFANPLGNGIDPDTIDNPRQVFGRAFTPEEDTEHWGIKGQLDYDGDGFNVEYIGSYRDLVYDYEFVTPAGPNFDGALELLQPFGPTFDNFSRVRFTTDSESQVHELRFFADEGARLNWTAGAFYFKEDQRTFLGTTGDRNPFFQGVEFNQTTDTESYSFYGDATYAVNDRFRVTGGIRYTNDTKERFGINARYAFGVGGPDFSCCFVNGIASGTEGFEFAGLDRTLFNPDQNGDGQVDAPESIAFFFDGIAQFGVRDGFDDVFPGGQQIQDAIPDPAQRPSCDAFAFVGSCGNFVPVFDGVVDFSLAPFNSTFALQNGRLDNDFVDWRIRAEYDLADDHLLYALVSTGNKSGGFNDNIPNTNGLGVASPAQNAPVDFDVDTLAPQFGPETLTLFEVGSKNEWQSGDTTIKFNVSAFYYDYDDLQLTTLTSTAQILDFEGVDTSNLPDLDALAGQIVAFTFNASDAEIYGAQFEGGLKLPGNWNIDATLLWLPEARVVNSQEIQDSRFQADVDPENSVNRSIEGNRLIRTPEVQLNASIGKVVDTSYGQYDGVVSFGYRSSQFMTIFNSDDFGNTDEALRLDDRVGGYVTIDAGFGLSFGKDNKYRIEAYVQNLTNIQRPQAIIITQFDNTRFFNTPRLYGLRARARF
ncbi:TonB-dependent receptor [Kordiimonas sp. SCSIO 12610]|uniref:TonB-dependent receptor n=1 Tax=Kordiimonas sp. SCSIO 12610 TaxID=2829597 RepID=UPI00210BF6BE|nr:TonB-dependent receptor [Kordiimonas sp. SCSIO 12610]UTW54705.1 TonB-dependent receptor [Kordiimonas sp. SCSIO 12610]